MDIKLAPRPKNEERRIVAVKRTGLIDGGQNDNFAIFSKLPKHSQVGNTLPSVFLMKTFSVKYQPPMELITTRAKETSLMSVLMFSLAQNQHLFMIFQKTKNGKTRN